METIFVLLPLALLIAAVAVGFFVWAARTGQFDDLDTPAVRILFDDEEPRPKPADTSAAGSRDPGRGGGAPQGPATAETRRVPR